MHRSGRTDPTNVYDYIVIGAGSAGCTLASRLTESPHISVLLIEAGPPDRKREIHIPAAFSKLFKTPVDWNFTTEPQEHLGGRSLYWPRGQNARRQQFHERHDLHPRPRRISTIGGTWATKGGDSPTCCRFFNPRKPSR